MSKPYQPARAHWLRAGAGIVALAIIAGCGDKAVTDNSTANATGDAGGSSAQSGKYSAEIRRTAYGIPHIKAADEGSLGFGVAYAYAQDNFCMLADEILTVNGARSRYLGPDANASRPGLTNLQTDYFYQIINDADAVAKALQAQPPAMRALLQGYAAGYNRFLAQTGAAQLPADCKNAAWVRNIDETDMMKLIRRYAAEGGSGQFVAAIVGAAPPGAATPAPAPVPAAQNPMTPQYWKRLHARTGSNAVALGRDGSANGQGLLLSNPHFPWQGTLRFYQLHLTIPGKLDAMGASLGGMPVVNIGFNQNLAWGHTVNTSAHFTAHLLALDPSDPTRYLVDGKATSMSKRTISVDVKEADGVVRKHARDFYSTPFGLLAVISGTLDWSAQTAYTIHDANLDNSRMLEQWNAMNRAATLDEFKGAIDRIVGLPWVNTIAADNQGNALYMDVTVVPNLSQAKLAACVPAPFQSLAAQGLFVLSGTTSACQWDNDSAAPQAGIFAGASLPRLARNDFVQNSNDSAWMSNPAAPLTGFSPIVSVDGQELSGRTRIGVSQLQARLAGTDGLGGRGMSMAQMQSLVLSNRVYYAQQTMDDVLRLCAGDKSATADDGSAVDLSTPCAQLASWDRSANLNANIGYAYFGGMFERIRAVPNVWAVPFNPADPINTPRGLNLADAGVAAQVRTALASAVRDAAAQGWSASTVWGDIQGVTRGAKRIPIHGGKDEYGVYNAVSTVPLGNGQLEVVEGTSYLQTVMFDASGPQAQAVLSYSQSTDPASPYYADQTELFSRKSWVSLPFTDTQIKADPGYRTTVISR